MCRSVMKAALCVSLVVEPPDDELFSLLVPGVCLLVWALVSTLENPAACPLRSALPPVESLCRVVCEPSNVNVKRRKSDSDVSPEIVVVNRLKSGWQTFPLVEISPLYQATTCSFGWFNFEFVSLIPDV